MTRVAVFKKRSGRFKLYLVVMRGARKPLRPAGWVAGSRDGGLRMVQKRIAVSDQPYHGYADLSDAIEYMKRVDVAADLDLFTWRSASRIPADEREVISYISSYIPKGKTT